MNVYRYNPVFAQWVLLGSPVASTIEVTERHLLDVGRTKDFVAASMPRQPFIVDPPRASKDPDFLYQPQPPVGEAEIFLYSGAESFGDWDAAIWTEWLAFVATRLKQAYHNPHLHFVKVVLQTGALGSAGSAYQRVGDLIATSHPVAGNPPAMTADLLRKLRSVEDAFVVLKGEAADVYVPSAPLNDKEAWILPESPRPCFEKCPGTERANLALTLATTFGALRLAYPRENWTMTLHTSLEGMDDDGTWWIQLHAEESRSLGSVPVRPLPEAFARHLEHALISEKRRAA